MRKIRKLFLSPVGRMGRVPFIIGAVGLMALYIAQHFIYPYLGKGLASFFVPMVFFFFNLHIVYCICGKRLHDLGRTTWPLFGMIGLFFITLLIIGLKFGMLDYFEAVWEIGKDPELQKDLAARRAAIQPLEEVYTQNLKANMHIIYPLAALVPLAFTIWLAWVPGQKDDNRYGVAT